MSQRVRLEAKTRLKVKAFPMDLPWALELRDAVRAGNHTYPLRDAQHLHTWYVDPEHDTHHWLCRTCAVRVAAPQREDAND